MKGWRVIAVLLVLLLLLTVVSVWAQSPYRNEPEPTTRSLLQAPAGGIRLGGLLDPSRISMSHQMGMSYMSLGKTGFTQGYYLNTMSYRFSSPVLLRLRLGVTNNPFMQNSTPGSSPFGPSLGEAEFFGGADLDWRPMDNVFIRFSFDKVPPGYYNPYGYGFGYDRFSPLNRFHTGFETPAGTP